jgi:hypothetical protein
MHNKHIFNSLHRKSLRTYRLIALCGVAMSVLAVVGHAQCISITSYGGNGNGVADNAPALSASFAALPATGGCISFPAGRFLFKTPVTLTYPSSTDAYSLTLTGAGQDATVLYWAASNGITINMSSSQQNVHVRDVTFSTGFAGTYAALTFKYSSTLGVVTASDVSHVFFRGDDGGQKTEYWDIGVNDAGLSYLNFDTDTFIGTNTQSGGGTGIFLNGSGGSPTPYSVLFNISKSGFFGLGTGLMIGNYVQGISLSQNNFTGGTTGIWAIPGTSGVDEVAISGGNQFNTFGNDIEFQGGVAHLIMSGNLLFVQPGNSGVFIQSSGGQQHTITNNVFFGVSPTGATGIYVGGLNMNAVVSGNVFNNLDTGVNLIGTQGWNVQGNSYLAVPSQVANIGTGNLVGVATN